MSMLVQSLVFEKMNEGSFKDTLALMNTQIRGKVEAFRSEQLTLDAKSPNKMMYDSVRIIGLRIATDINSNLIRLSHRPEDLALKQNILKLVVHICNNSMLLRYNDKHLIANYNHLSYSQARFGDVLERTNLTAVFTSALIYIQQTM